MEYTTRWTAYTLRIPVSFFNRAGRPSPITLGMSAMAVRATDACDAITGIDVAIFEKGFIKAYMSSLMASQCKPRARMGRFPCDLDLASSISAPESFEALWCFSRTLAPRSTKLNRDHTESGHPRARLALGPPSMKTYKAFNEALFKDGDIDASDGIAGVRWPEPPSLTCQAVMGDGRPLG